MGENRTANATQIYAPAQAAINDREIRAADLASRSQPDTYQFDPVKSNKTASLLSRYKTEADKEGLRYTSPEAFQGQQDAISEISGGVAGDDAFLRSAALKSGLESAGYTGARIDGPSSVGGVTAANVFGRNLLDYRNKRNQERLALAGGLQPDSAIDVASGIEGIESSKAGAIQQKNNWQQYLNNLRFGSVANQQNQAQQAVGVAQNQFNSDLNARMANRAMTMEMATRLAESGAQAAAAS